MDFEISLSAIYATSTSFKALGIMGSEKLGIPIRTCLLIFRNNLKSILIRIKFITILLGALCSIPVLDQ